MFRPDGRRIQIGGNQMETRWIYDGNFKFDVDGVVRIGGHRGDAYSLAWRAPADGIYDVEATVGIASESVAGGGVIHARLSVPGNKERECVLGKGQSGALVAQNIELHAGDQVKILSDLRDMWGVGPLEIRNFKIVKKKSAKMLE